MSRSARVLTPGDLRRVVAYANSSSAPRRDTVIVELSYRAGLRACEIAGLTWDMVTTPDGKLATAIDLRHSIAKNGRGRQIPMHPALRRALRRLREQGYSVQGPVIRSRKGGHMKPRSVVNWFASAYQALGFAGCSSHSGRRTFITRAARLLSKTGGSLRDVQELAGHRALTTTERYIEGDRDAQRRLVRML